MHKWPNDWMIGVGDGGDRNIAQITKQLIDLVI